MADAFETLLALAQNGAQIPPDVIISLSSLPASVKKEIMGKLEKSQQQNPMVQQAAQIELAQKTADVGKTQAETALAQARAGVQQAEVGKKVAETGKIGVQAGKEQAQAVKTMVDAHQAAVPQIAPEGPVEQAMQGPAPSDPEGMEGGLWGEPAPEDDNPWG
jgi:predicted TIM-barrel enzyme